MKTFKISQFSNALGAWMLDNEKLNNRVKFIHERSSGII